VAVALAALLITRQRLATGLGTALAVLVVVNVAGHLFLADVGQGAIASNRAIMQSLTFYILLALLAFNLAAFGELNGASLGTALVLGVLSTLVVGLAGYGGEWFPSGPSIIIHTYLGWMAAAALSVSLVPLFMPEEGVGGRFGLLLITGILMSLVVLSLVRAAWVAAAITLVLIAFRSRRRAYVLILIVAVGLALLTPTARQLISRSESGDIIAQLETGGITTGRLDLWTSLWERAEPALPWGNGFGYIWSLTSEDLVGVPDQFGTDTNGILPPHDDFVYLLVEFGIPGVVLLVLFWLLLLRSRALVIQSADPQFRRSGWLLLGMIVAGLMVALVDDVFLVRPFAERFFPVAGFILGLAYLERARRMKRPRSNSSLTT
jgi:O-antigen ligase